MPADDTDGGAFVFDSAEDSDVRRRVEAGEKRHFEYPVGETYLGQAVEMGEADRFQPVLIERAVWGVENVMAASDLRPEAETDPSAFGKGLEDHGDDEWISAGTGGLVDMKWGPEPIVNEGRRSASSRITSPRTSTSWRRRSPVC